MTRPYYLSAESYLSSLPGAGGYFHNRNMATQTGHDWGLSKHHKVWQKSCAKCGMWHGDARSRQGPLFPLSLSFRSLRHGQSMVVGVGTSPGQPSTKNNIYEIYGSKLAKALIFEYSRSYIICMIIMYTASSNDAKSRDVQGKICLTHSHSHMM